jgi:HD-like signal output (HDOD) protein
MLDRVLFVTNSKYSETEMKTDINKIIQKIDSLTPMPAVTSKIMEIAGDPDGSIADLTDVLQYDAELTSNVLKICNSTYYGLTVKVDSAKQAISLLGMNRVLEMVLLANTGENMIKVQQGYGLERGDLWKNSVATALVSRSIAENKKDTDQFRVYTASLIKDIGKVIIDSYVGKSIKKIQHLVDKKGYGFDQAEAAVIGIDHATLGGIIAEKWHFSPQMIFMISNHHLNEKTARDDVETSIVYLADTISRMVGIGIGADGLAYKVYEDIFDKLGVSEEDVQQIMADFKVSLNMAGRLLLSL